MKNGHERRRKAWIDLQRELAVGAPNAIRYLRRLGCQLLEEDIEAAERRLSSVQQDVAHLATKGKSLKNKQIAIKGLTDSISGQRRELARLRGDHAWASDAILTNLLTKAFGLTTYVIRGHHEFVHCVEVVDPFGEAFIQNLGHHAHQADSGVHWQPILGDGPQSVPGDGDCGFHAVLKVLESYRDRAIDHYDLSESVSESQPHFPESTETVFEEPAFVRTEGVEVQNMPEISETLLQVDSTSTVEPSLLDLTSNFTPDFSPAFDSMALPQEPKRGMLQQSILEASLKNDHEILRRTEEAENHLVGLSFRRLQEVLSRSIEIEAMLRERGIHNSDFLAIHAASSHLDEKGTLVRILSRAAAHMPELAERLIREFGSEQAHSALLVRQSFFASQAPSSLVDERRPGFGIHSEAGFNPGILVK